MGLSGRRTNRSMIETLGDALNYGWKLHVRCAWGKRDAMKSICECVYSREVDIETLVLTRGRACPIIRLDSLLKCPRCGSRRMSIKFSVPKEPSTASAQPSPHWTRRIA